MRLAPKIFLTSAVVVLVLAAVGFLSVRAVGRLVSVNREIADHAVPALRLTASLRDAMRSLSRLEARYVILRDSLYATMWYEGATRVETDLGKLAGTVRSDRQRAALAQATVAFEEYRQVVAEERDLMGRGLRAQALRLVDGEGAARAERVDAALDGVVRATEATTLSALREAARLEKRTWAWVVGGLGAAVGLALAGSGIVAFRMTRSLRQLSVATRAVADGSFNAPIATPGRDEVGDLARSFNSMAQQLRQVDEMKEEFFATISHDLKSPLGSISEAAYLLREGATGSLTSRQSRLVGIIAASADRILGLVNRLLDLSRLRSGVLPLQSKPVNLAVVADRVLEELRPQAETAGVRLGAEREGADFVVEGDEERLAEVVVNLTTNALRFTPKGGDVRVRLAETNREVVLVVADTGVGIPPDALSGIFERYRQVRSDRGGSGLGLAIVRGVVDAHGGRVTVESSEGKGTCFTVILPRVRPSRMSGARWLAALALLAGCVTAPPPPAPVVAPPPAPAPAPAPTPSALLLARADRLLVQGDYAQASQAYADFARQYPDDRDAPRGLAARDALETLAASREAVSRLTAEVLGMKEQAQDAERDLDRLRRELGARAAELARVRQELGERQADLTKLLAEVAELRANVERLKNVDLRLERRP